MKDDFWLGYGRKLVERSHCVQLLHFCDFVLENEAFFEQLLPIIDYLPFMFVK